MYLPTDRMVIQSIARYSIKAENYLFSFSRARLAKPFSPYFNINGINAGTNLPRIGNFNDIRNDRKKINGTT